LLKEQNISKPISIPVITQNTKIIKPRLLGLLDGAILYQRIGLSIDPRQQVAQFCICLKTDAAIASEILCF
jgi:hypothetical protein